MDAKEAAPREAYGALVENGLDALLEMASEVEDIACELRYRLTGSNPNRVAQEDHESKNNSVLARWDGKLRRIGRRLQQTREIATDVLGEFPANVEFAENEDAALINQRRYVRPGTVPR